MGFWHIIFAILRHLAHKQGQIKNSVIFKIVKFPLSLTSYQWFVPLGAQSLQTSYYITLSLFRRKNVTSHPVALVSLWYSQTILLITHFCCQGSAELCEQS